MRYSNKKIARFSVLLTIALAIWVIEEFIPRPMPWLKPGFSYIAVLLAMYEFGALGGVALAIMRVFIGSLILGKLFSPAFILSISGTLAAVMVMTLLFPLRGKFLSFVGISVAGAFSHIAVQIIVAGAMFYRPDAVLWLLPVSAMWAVIAGAVVGIIAGKISTMRMFIHARENCEIRT